MTLRLLECRLGVRACVNDIPPRGKTTPETKAVCTYRYVCRSEVGVCMYKYVGEVSVGKVGLATNARPLFTGRWKMMGVSAFEVSIPAE